MKCCTVCKVMKDQAAFAKKGGGKLRSDCRACVSEKNRARYQKDAEFRERAIQAAARNRPDFKTMEAAEVERIRAARRRYKLLGRICAAPGFKPTHHDAHVRLWASYIKTRAPHDAHVRAFQALHLDVLLDAHVRAWRTRQRWMRRDQQATTQAGRIKRRATAREQLAESYIVRLLTDNRRTSREAAGISSDFIELKRAHLRLVRFLNEAKEAEA